MLANTLCHIPRVSLNKERSLWENGIHTWDNYRSITKTPEFLLECEKQFKDRNSEFFANVLKSDQHWRLFGDFNDSVAYVDIETTGLRKEFDEITTIALFNGFELKTYVNGKNLEAFAEEISGYKLLVTFNGKCFDVPFIQHTLGITMPKAHIDLRYVFKRLGLSGGLKEIERRIGIDRGLLKSVDGFFAVTLWNEYKRRNNKAALETLLAYNCTDVVNLEHLMVLAFNQNVKHTPFGNIKQMQIPKPFQIPFQADSRLLDRYC